MGRRKIEIKRVKDPAARQVTFSKRRKGLFKKANELAVFTGAEIAIIVFSPGNKPYSFGHPNVDAVLSNFHQQEVNPNDHVLENPSSNMEDLDQTLENVLEELAEVEKEAKAHDEILKEYQAALITQPKKFKDLFLEFKGMVKSRLCELEVAEAMMLLAKEPVIGTKNQVTKRKRKN